MQNFINSGDARKYNDFDNMVTRGAWVLYRDGRHRISWSRGLWGQGWQTERLVTTLHEGIHETRPSWTDAAAESFGQNCINW